jgi:hypothetical protein
MMTNPHARHALELLNAVRLEVEQLVKDAALGQAAQQLFTDKATNGHGHKKLAKKAKATKANGHKKVGVKVASKANGKAIGKANGKAPDSKAADTKLAKKTNGTAKGAHIADEILTLVAEKKTGIGALDIGRMLKADRATVRYHLLNLRQKKLLQTQGKTRNTLYLPC